MVYYDYGKEVKIGETIFTNSENPKKLKIPSRSLDKYQIGRVYPTELRDLIDSITKKMKVFFSVHVEIYEAEKYFTVDTKITVDEYPD